MTYSVRIFFGLDAVTIDRINVLVVLAECRCCTEYKTSNELPNIRHNFPSLFRAKLRSVEFKNQQSSYGIRYKN
jgi:hypothetical protein